MPKKIRLVVEGEEFLGLQKLCTRCTEWWPLDKEFFHPQKNGVDGFQRWCRACMLEYWKENAERRKGSRLSVRIPGYTVVVI